jgi:uncharacterized protein YcfJ
MSRLVVAAFLVGFAVVTSAQTPPPASAPTAPTVNVHYGWAQVLRVEPVYAPVSSSQPNQCGQSGATRRRESTNKAPSAAADAVRADTSRSRQGTTARADTATQPPKCPPIDRYAPQQEIVAYNVEYRYRGNIYMSRLPYDPGERLRVRVTIAPAD